MKNVRRNVLTAILVVAGITILFGASNYLTNVDASGFPNVKLYFTLNTTIPSLSSVSVTENGQVATIQKLKKLSEEENEKVDVVFALDTTGSMEMEIQAMINNIDSFANLIDSKGFDARFAVVTYGDKIRKKMPFTSDAESLREELEGVSARAGGDSPEITLDAINYAMGMGFRKNAQKIIIVITDSSTHYKGDGTGFSNLTAQDIIKKDNLFGYTLIMVAPLTSRYKEIANSVSGKLYDIQSVTSFDDLINEIGKEISNQYVLEYKSNVIESSKKVDVLLSINTPSGIVNLKGSYTTPAAYSGTDYIKDIIWAKGYGCLNTQLPKSQALILARNAAIIDAERNLMEIVKGVQISRNRTVADALMSDNNLLKTNLDNFLKGVEVVKTTYDSILGVFGAEVAVKLYGDNSLLEIVNFKYTDWGNMIVQAIGWGAIKEKGNISQNIVKARNAAIADAQAQLLGIIKGVHITSNKIVQNAIEESDIVTEAVQGTIRGARIKSERYDLKSGIYQVTMIANLNETLKLGQKYFMNILKLQSQLPSVDLSKYGENVSLTTGNNATISGKYTGLIIDASALNIQGSLFPKIYAVGGKIFYDGAMVDSNVRSAYSVVGYASSVNEAKKMVKRIGSNPLVVKALSLYPDSSTDILLSKSTIENIVSNMPNLKDIFSNARVVIVMGNGE
jgi:Mg-chelatase subunit ChlD